MINMENLPEKPTSIFDLPAFPAKIGTHPGGKPANITPKLWLQAIEKWETDPTIGLPDVCLQLGFSHSVLYDWRDRYIELQTRYEVARTNRAHLLAENTIAIADEPLNPDPKFATPAVRRAECRIGARQWLAERLHPKQYGSRQQIDQRVVSANINVNLSADDLLTTDPASILGNIRGE